MLAATLYDGVMQDKPRASVESFHEVYHPHSRSLSDASDGDDSLPDDTLASAFVDSRHQQSRGADMAMVSGIPVPGTDGYVQTPVPVTIDGQTQAHVVVASRQQLPGDATVVPAQFISPFAASTLQARAASSASSQL